MYLNYWVQTARIEHSESTPTAKHQDQSISVILAVYNEASMIRSCIDSILNNQYTASPLELIVVDNGSTDGTFELLQSIEDSRLKCFRHADGFKKEALEYGLSKASGSIILCTDGDSIVPARWIESMTLPIRNYSAKMVAGPIQYPAATGFIHAFQSFDLLAMMGITAGGITGQFFYLANGANFAYHRDVYNQIGEIPRKDIASGDDVFLIHSYAKQTDAQICFQKDQAAIVTTMPQTTWSDLIQQRIRWASKTSSYTNWKDLFISAYIFIFCSIICLLLPLAFFVDGLWQLSVLALCSKAVIDYLFLSKVNRFFNIRHFHRYFIPAFLLHLIYIVLAGLAGLFKLQYTWRKRVVKPV